MRRDAIKAARTSAHRSRLAAALTLHAFLSKPLCYLSHLHEFFLQALWAQFKPDAAVVDIVSWTMSKMGSPISPLEVVLNGSQSMHAVDDDGILVEGLGLQRSWEQLQIRQGPTPSMSFAHSRLPECGFPHYDCWTFTSCGAAHVESTTRKVSGS